MTGRNPFKVIVLSIGLGFGVLAVFNWQLIVANIKYQFNEPAEVQAESLTSAKLAVADATAGAVTTSSQYKYVGISNANLKKIPVGIWSAIGTDKDQDGLIDAMEVSLGTNVSNNDSDNDSFTDYQEVKKGSNPLGVGYSPLDLKFANLQKGKLLLQVDGRGELWYVASDSRRYYLPRIEQFSTLEKLLVSLAIEPFSLPKEVVTVAAKPKATISKANILKISSLGLSVPVQYVNSNDEPTMQKALEKGVVHYPGTAMPGDYGNVYIFGHSSDYKWRAGAYKSVFAILPKIKIGALMQLSDELGNTYTYKVYEAKVVEAKETKYLGQYGYERKLLTLQTSWPIGTALKRYVVIGELVE